MTFTLATLFLAIAVILLILSAIPPVPYGTVLARIGLAFGFAAFLVGGAV